MSRTLKLLSALIAIVLAGFISSCSEDDPPLADNVVSFSAAELGFDDEQTETTITINTLRSEDEDKTLSITLVSTGVTYGVEFTTEPAVVSDAITVTIPAGSTQTTFVVKKSAGVLLDGDESVVFTIQSVEEPFVLSQDITLTLKFSAIVSEGSTLTLQGKTDASNFTNTVYVDFSNNAQTAVDRKSWNLAFYSGSEFKVVLNSHAQTTAAALEKTDITTVTSEDANDVMNLNHDIADPATLALVDYYDGHLDSLVFADVSANADENKVYLVSFEGNKETDTWYKVKVNRSGEGYEVQYALIGETTIKTLAIAKSADYNFSFISLLTDQVVSVEPLKTNWDIKWGYDTYMSVATDPNSAPYWYQDFVVINYVAGAEAAEVVKADATEAATAYTNFSESDISGLTFSKARDAIGNKWRTTSGSSVGIKTDRFYVVKDPRGNVYKLKFVSMGVGSDGGERGRPVISYALVKKAED